MAQPPLEKTGPYAYELLHCTMHVGSICSLLGLSHVNFGSRQW